MVTSFFSGRMIKSEIYTCTLDENYNQYLDAPKETFEVSINIFTVKLEKIYVYLCVIYFS